MKRNTKQLIPMILVFTIIAAAYSCRILAMLDIGGAWVNYIRAALYLLLFSLWGYSIDRRIIQEAGTALPAPDRGADAGMAYFAHAEI